MGRTSKPLTLLVSDELAEAWVNPKPPYEWSRTEVEGYIQPIKLLKEQGNTVLSFENIQARWEWGDDEIKLSEFDLILGPNCQLMTLAHLKYLPEAIKRVRKVKYTKNDETTD